MKLDLMMPQEIEVLYVIPTIRSYLAFYMKENKKSQKEIAEMLNLRESTVSHYINKKRGCQIKLSRDIISLIKKLAKKVKTNNESRRYIQQILKKIRNTKEICSIHRQLGNIKCKCPLEKGCIY